MSAVLKYTLSTSLATAIINDVTSRRSRYYYYFGKVLSWNPFGEDLPEVPLENYKYELETRSNMTLLKRINENDVSYITKRIDWIDNLVYDMYDDSYSEDNLSSNGFSDLYQSNFYVLTDENNVYKCICNNYGTKSTVKPSGNDTNFITTADGYIWKFMYTIPIGLKNKFVDSDYIPVTTALSNQFYSNGTILGATIVNAGMDYVDVSSGVTVVGDGYLEENPYNLTEIIISSGGFGYTFIPDVIISEPTAIFGSEVQATATATLSSGVVNSITFNNFGFGYNNNAVAIIEEPYSGYVNWQAILPVTNSTIIKHNNNYYEVTSSGNLGTTPPTHTSGTDSNGSASLLYKATRAEAYITSTKTEALLDVVVDGLGQITNVIVIDGGVGYTFASIEVTGVGTGAELTVNLSNGDLNSLQSNVELLAVDGAISYIKVESEGSAYGEAIVVIEGDGTGATAEVTITSGRITDITITNYGSGYTWATASIVGSGTGCVARVIISPKGGHGKDAVYELGSNGVMFFTSIANEKNQGVTVNNDSRQIGIIKSPKTFDSGFVYTKASGSACYLLIDSTQVDQNKFFPDVKLTSESKEYYIVGVEDNKLLISSNKNSEPTVGASFISENGDVITPFKIDTPEVDKYSGDIIFIDNRNAFITTSEQSLSLRTIITF